MNIIANGMEWGTVGSAVGWDIDMFPFTDVDAENQLRADGKPMFRYEEDEKGNSYWYMDAVYKTDANVSKDAAVYDLRNTETKYAENDEYLKAALPM